MKKKSAYRLLSIVLCLLLTLSLTGCKSGAVKNTEKLITAIGEVTADSKDAVEAAEAAYEALSDSDKAKVEGVDALKSARDDLDKALRVKNVADLIDAVGAEITVESKEAVEAAEAALAALPEAEKALLTNAEALTAAREALDKARREAVLGVWYYSFDGTELIAGQLAEEFGMNEEEITDTIGTFEIPIKLELREDGTYQGSAEPEKVKEKMVSLLETLKPQLRELVIRGIGESLAEAGLTGDLSTQEGIEAALGSSLDELMKISSGYTLDELLDQAIEEAKDGFDAEQYVQTVEGNYLLDLDKSELCFSEQLNDEPDPAEAEQYRLEEGGLVIYDHTGKGFFGDSYPLTFTREP